MMETMIDDASSSVSRRHARRLLLPALAMAIAFVFSAGACKSSDDDQMLVRLLLIDVDPSTRLGTQSIDREGLRAQVQSLLDDDPSIKLREGAKKGVTMRVRLAPSADETPAPRAFPFPTSTEDTGGALSLSVEASIDDSHNGGASFRYKGTSTSDNAGSLPPAAILENLFRDAVDQVLLARRARNLDDKTLIGWLSPGAEVSPDQKRQAVRVLGARKTQAAIPALIRVLQSDDRMLAVHALGALSAAEPEGENKTKVVSAIIEFAEAKATIIRKQAIAAVGRIDVPLARAWLWTMSGGHPDADVRSRAHDALALMDPAIFADATSAKASPKVAEQTDRGDGTKPRAQ